MAVYFFQADTDLNTDPAAFGYDSADVAMSAGWGTPGNSPSGLFTPWNTKIYMAMGQPVSASAIWTGIQEFSDMTGKYTRNFSRVYSNGSASFTTWVKLASTQIVQSVNGQAGSVSFSLVNSFNGQSGAVSAQLVNSINGSSGAVTLTYVSSFNGMIGAVTQPIVTSVNGRTGSVTVSLAISGTGGLLGVTNINGTHGDMTVQLNVSAT